MNETRERPWYFHFKSNLSAIVVVLLGACLGCDSEEHDNQCLATHLAATTGAPPIENKSASKSNRTPAHLEAANTPDGSARKVDTVEAAKDLGFMALSYAAENGNIEVVSNERLVYGALPENLKAAFMDGVDSSYSSHVEIIERKQRETKDAEFQNRLAGYLAAFKKMRDAIRAWK